MRSPSGRASMEWAVPIVGRIGLAAVRHNARAKEKLWRARLRAVGIRQLSLVTCRADFERGLGRPGHESLKVHEHLSAHLFVQPGDLPGFSDERVTSLFRVLDLKLEGLDG